MTPIPLHQHSNDALDVDALLSQLGTADRAIMETYLAMLAEAQITGASDKVSQAEVAAEMGVNQARVSRVIKKLRILMHKNPHLG
jgi:DNA-directed RNA polymerase specialized sigma subunit